MCYDNNFAVIQSLCWFINLPVMFLHIRNGEQFSLPKHPLTMLILQVKTWKVGFFNHRLSVAALLVRQCRRVFFPFLMSLLSRHNERLTSH